MAIREGGPVFPSGDYRSVQPVEGMSLRDYFAVQALASFAGDTRGVVVAVSNRRGIGHDSGMVQREARNVAEAAYALADAMLKAREATHE